MTNKRTKLVDVDEAKERLASGEQPYEFELSDKSTILGPTCQFGEHYLQYLRKEGRYAESLAEATEITQARGVSITGVWFVSR